MSVRNSLLALLSSQSMGAAQLQKEFTERTSHTWALNIGQVFTTLQRLERDGLVSIVGEEASGSVENYTLTEQGQLELAQWWRAPVPREKPERNELVMKVAFAVVTPGVDVHAVLQAQRMETMRSLHDLAKLSAHAGNSGSTDIDHAWMLMIDQRVFAAEAEMRWLDHVEARIARWRSEATHLTQSHGSAVPGDSERAEELREITGGRI